MGAEEGSEARVLSSCLDSGYSRVRVALRMGTEKLYSDPG